MFSLSKPSKAGSSTKVLLVKVLAATIIFTGPVSAFWRMPCRARSGLARIDPLISNGTLSNHAHALHGSDGLSTTSGYDELVAGDCTSCEVTQDKSAYWTPALYFQDSSTNEFTLVNQVGGMLAYYLLYPNSGNSSLTGFPAGFEMIAGDTNQRNFTYPVPDIQKSLWTGVYQTQAFLRQAALGFNCLNYAKTAEGSLYRHFLPDKAYLDANCADGVRFELMFPSCWNRAAGVTSEDKKSHVAYPSQVMTGDCPDGFSERLPSLFFETIWDTSAFANQSGQFVLANGDPTGYGYHGDFMMGWDQKFLQSAVDTCTNLSGQIEDCALFDIQSSEDYSNCNVTLPSALAREDVVGAMSTLPGNPTINYGPGYADDTTDDGNSASSVSASTAVTTAGSIVSAPTLGYQAGSSLASTDTYVPGGIFAVSTGSSATFSAFTGSSSASATFSAADIVANVASSSSAIVTPAPSLSSAVTSSDAFFSTDYSTSGRNVMELLWVEETITISQDATSTVSVPALDSPAAARRKRHLHQHRGVHH